MMEHQVVVRPPALYQFQVDGVTAPVHTEWRLAALDAVAAGYANWVGEGQLCLYHGAKIGRI